MEGPAAPLSKSPCTGLQVTVESKSDSDTDLQRQQQWISHSDSEPPNTSEIDETDTQLVEFVQGEVFESDALTAGTDGTHSHYVQQIVHIRSSPQSPGETVRVIRVPVSVLASNLQSLQVQHQQPPHQGEFEPTEISIIQDDTLSQVQQEGQDVQQKEQPTPEIDSVEESNISVIQIQEFAATMDTKSNSSSLSMGDAMRMPKRRSNLRKNHKLFNSDQIAGGVIQTSLKLPDQENVVQNQDHSILNDEPPSDEVVEEPVTPPEPFPVDRCANCMNLFNNETEKFRTVCREMNKVSKVDEVSSCEPLEVSILEALHLIFNISQEFKRDYDECFVCEQCATILKILYSAFKDFTELTEENSYVLRKLKEISILEGANNKKGKGKRRKQPDPRKMSTAAGRELSCSEIKAEVEWEEEDEEDEYIFGDFSDDEDFQASPSDLAAVGVESSSSSSDDEIYVPIKKKKILTPKKSRKSRSALDENFFWSDDIKHERLSSDDDIDGKTRRRKSTTKSRNRKSVLTGLTYDCNLCDGSFQKPRELKKHLQEFHKKTHQCFDAIENKQQDDGELVDLLPIVEPEHSCVCRICSKELITKNALKDHFAAEHEGELPFTCEKCDRSFYDLSTLRRHEISHIKPYKCKVCRNLSFRRADELRSHWALEHVYGEDENVTDPIKKNISSFRKTKKVKSKIDKSVPCDVCGKSFQRLDHLRLHMRIHTGEKPFQCNVCTKAFSDPRGLAYHEVTHSNERPYCCTICGMTFKRLHHLNDHERNHREDIERPFACTICNKCFKYKKHLNSHMVIHGNSKDHRCELCSKAFNRKDNLRQHVKKVHGKEPGPSTMSLSSVPSTSLSLTTTSTSPTTTTTIVTAIPIEASLDQIVYMHL